IEIIYFIIRSAAMEITKKLSSQQHINLGSKIKINFTVIGIILFTLSFSILKSFIPFQISYILLGLSFTVLLFSNFLINKRGIIITSVDMMWLLFLLIFIMNITINNLINMLIVYDIFVYALGIFILLLIKVDISNYKYPLKILQISGLIYGISAIFQYLFPDIYLNSILS